MDKNNNRKGGIELSMINDHNSILAAIMNFEKSSVQIMY